MNPEFRLPIGYWLLCPSWPELLCCMAVDSGVSRPSSGHISAAGKVVLVQRCSLQPPCCLLGFAVGFNRSRRQPKPGAPSPFSFWWCEVDYRLGAGEGDQVDHCWRQPWGSCSPAVTAAIPNVCFRPTGQGPPATNASRALRPLRSRAPSWGSGLGITVPGALAPVSLQGRPCPLSSSTAPASGDLWCLKSQCAALLVTSLECNPLPVCQLWVPDAA